MENINTKEKNKEKLKKTAHVINKVIKIVKIVLIVMAAILVTMALVSAILGAAGVATKFYEQFSEQLAGVKIDYKNESLMFLDKKAVYLSELYMDGSLNLLLYGLAVSFLGSAAGMVITVILLHFAQKVFILMENSESPFDKSLLKPFRIIFIIITIVAVFKASVFFGLLVGGLLLCMYFIYAYGCNMQEDEDHTL